MEIIQVTFDLLKGNVFSHQNSLMKSIVASLIRITNSRGDSHLSCSSCRQIDGFVKITYWIEHEFWKIVPRFTISRNGCGLYFFWQFCNSFSQRPNCGNWSNFGILLAFENDQNLRFYQIFDISVGIRVYQCIEKTPSLSHDPSVSVKLGMFLQRVLFMNHFQREFKLFSHYSMVYLISLFVKFTVDANL